MNAQNLSPALCAGQLAAAADRMERDRVIGMSAALLVAAGSIEGGNTLADVLARFLGFTPPDGGALSQVQAWSSGPGMTRSKVIATLREAAHDRAQDAVIDHD